MAERVGFEPTEAYASSVFKTDAIDHSATSPGCCGRGQYLMRGAGICKVEV
jgi:hypothetical protein